MGVKTLAVLQFEFRAMMAKRDFLIATAAFPLIGLAIILVVRLITSMGEDGPSTLGYVDHWGPLPDQVPAESGLRAFPDEAQARAALLAGDIDAYLVVPQDYVESGVVRRFSTSEGSIFEGSEPPEVLRALLVQALLAGQVGPQVVARVQAPVRLERVQLTPAGEVAPPGRDEFSRFFIPYGFSVLLAVSIFTSAAYLSQSVAEEKQTRTMEVLLSSVSPSELLAGKILGLGAAGALQIGVWLVTAWLLSRTAGSLLPLPGALDIDVALLAVVALYFLLGYFFFASVLAGVGAMATTPQESSQLGTFVMLPAAVPFFILSFIISEPNGTIARVLTFIPLTAPLTAMLRLSAATPPWPDLLGGAVVLVASTVMVIFLSARVFRAFVLLYGRRPGLAEFWRALRTSG